MAVDHGNEMMPFDIPLSEEVFTNGRTDTARGNSSFLLMPQETPSEDSVDHLPPLGHVRGYLQLASISRNPIILYHIYFALKQSPSHTQSFMAEDHGWGQQRTPLAPPSQEISISFYQQCYKIPSGFITPPFLFRAMKPR